MPEDKKRHSNADQPNENRQPATLREAWNRRFGKISQCFDIVVFAKCFAKKKG
jgi:hypothetical protein